MPRGTFSGGVPDPRWVAVEEYFTGLLAPQDSGAHALAESDAAGLPAINVAPNQAKFLALLVRLTGAKRVLEVGTLGGYSAIWMARALPEGGRIVTLELDPRHAEVARRNFAAAGVDDRIDLREGAALETLPEIAHENGAPFDLAFIDADKESNAAYFSWALRLSRPGSLIVVDNVVRKGEVVDDSGRSAQVEGVRRLTELVAAEPRVEATVLQTVGTKGYDGLMLAYVLR